MEKIMAYRRFMRDLLFNRILYLGEKIYLIDKDGQIEETGDHDAGGARLIVLGKNHYFETLKTFPFSSVKDIRSAVKTDIHAFSPFETDLFLVKRISETGERTSVNLWFVNKAGCEKLQALSPLFIIPETALLPFVGDALPTVYAIRKTNDERLFSFVREDGGVKSMAPQRDSADLTLFKRSVGGRAIEAPVREVTEWEGYFGMIQTSLYEIPPKTAFSFTNRDYFSTSFNKKPLSVGIAVAVVLFFMYTGLSLFMPYMAVKGLNREDKALSLNLSGLLEKQDMVVKYQQRHKALAEKLNRYTYKVPLLNLLNTVLPEETTVRQFTAAGNMVEIRGVVPEATALLTALTQVKEVKTAQFTSPLRQDPKTGMEAFTLTFVYEQDENLGEGGR
jgi:hypothetical protein